MSNWNRLVVVPQQVVDIFVGRQLSCQQSCKFIEIIIFVSNIAFVSKFDLRAIKYDVLGRIINYDETHLAKLSEEDKSGPCANTITNLDLPRARK